MSAPNKDVQQALITAYYARAVQHADTLRTRALTAFTVAGALAATLIGVGLLGNLSQLTALGRALALSAAALWLVAAAVFVITTAKPHRPNDSDIADSAAMANWVATTSFEDQTLLSKKLRLATLLAGAAAAATTASIAVIAFQAPSNSAHNVNVMVTHDGETLLATACHAKVPGVFTANVTGVTSTAPYLEVVVSSALGRGCRVLLPRTSVLGLFGG